MPPIPPIHRDDAVWLSLFDRAVVGVLAFISKQLEGTGGVDLSPDTTLAVQVCRRVRVGNVLRM